MSFCLGSIVSIATDLLGFAQPGRSITLQVSRGWGIRCYAERGGLISGDLDSKYPPGKAGGFKYGAAQSGGRGR